MRAAMGHEKLRVYQRGLEYAAWMQSVLAGIGKEAAVLDHWDRATESIIEGIANANSRRSRSDRNQYFNVAIGSALECAACLDICRCRKMITEAQQIEGKEMLQPIVTMIIGLRECQSAYIKEDPVPYRSSRHVEVHFAHESLDAYKVALELVVWIDRFLDTPGLGSSCATRLDRGTTSLVLNIAEGNGRFSEVDQMRFLDIAHTGAMQVAACLDLLVARGQIGGKQVEEGKVILARIVPLLLGLRGYLDESKEQGE